MDIAEHITAVGLEGKPTSTVPGDEVHAELKRIESKLGKYPHSKLDFTKLDQMLAWNPCGRIPCQKAGIH